MVKKRAVEVSQLIHEWDEITARLWKGGYREADFLRPEFQEYLRRLTSRFAAMADWARQMHPRLAGLGELPIEAKPTQPELLRYARDFDCIRLKKMLPQLGQVAEQRGIDSSTLISLGSVMTTNMADAETIPFADAAWTTVERLRNRIADEPDRSAAKQSQPRDDSPTPGDLKNGGQVLAAMSAKNPSRDAFMVAMRNAGFKISSGKAGLILHAIKNLKK